MFGAVGSLHAFAALQGGQHPRHLSSAYAVQGAVQEGIHSRVSEREQFCEIEPHGLHGHFERAQHVKYLCWKPTQRHQDGGHGCETKQLLFGQLSLCIPRMRGGLSSEFPNVNESGPGDQTGDTA